MPALLINQFTNGPTGHVNITLVASDGAKITYGANLGPSVGVQIETKETDRRIANNPGAYSFHEITLTQAQYNSVLAFAQAADAGNNAYAAFCNNCVDFADRALAAAGFGRFAIANYLKDGTLTDVYAELAKYICVDGNWMYSGYDAPDFTDATAANAVFQSAFGYQPDWSWTGDVMDMLDLLQGLMGKSAFDEEMKWARQAWLDAGGSPIAIDLNGDGLVTTSYTPSKVRFDVTGDGVAEKTAWLSAEDAFLVVDRNANHQIDDVNEMFGGLLREEGYKELALYDSNHDRRLDAQDDRFGELLLWRDANTDGVTQDGELLALADAGVHSIDLNYSRSTLVDHGNLIGEASSASSAHGELFVGDVYFQYDRERPAPFMPQAGGMSVSDGGIDGNAASAGGNADILLSGCGRTSTPLHMAQITVGSRRMFDSQVASMVQAMASMTPPAMGQATLIEATRAQLAPILVANWS